MGAIDSRIAVAPGRVAAVLGGILLALLLAHAAGLVLTYGLGHDHALGLVPLFNIGLEGNVPTFFASGLLFLSSFLFLALWRAGEAGEHRKKTWLLLSAIFLFLSVDEFASIHELLIEPLRNSLGTGGLLFFAWVIPYGAAVVVLGIVVAPSLWALGSRYRLLFGVSAAMFLGGAIGVEMLGGAHIEAQYGVVDLRYRLLQTVEETLEFSGVIILIYTLLDLLRAKAASFNIVVR